MAEVIASWQVGAFVDPQNGQSPIDADDVRANDNTMRVGFNDHDADPGIHFQGSTLGARPTAGTGGRKWFTSDTKQIFRDNGSSWDEIDYLNRSNGGTVAGDVTFSGAITSTSGSRTFGATTFTGTVSGTSASFSSTISSAGATFTGAISGTSASFSSTVSAAGATLTGALAGTSATFSSTLGVTGVATFSGGATIASGKTLTLTGATVAGQPTWSSGQTFPSLTVSGTSSLTTLSLSSSSTTVALSATGSALGGTGLEIDNTNAASRGGYVAFKQGGSYRGFMGVSGAILGSTATNLALQAYTGQQLEFYTNGSTSAGMSLSTSNALTIANGLTVSASTTSVQALTATTGTFTGNIAGVGATFSKSAADPAIQLNRIGATNNPSYQIQVEEAGNRFIIGRTGVSNDFTLTSGAAAFIGSVTATNFLSSSPAISAPNNTWTNVQTLGNVQGTWLVSINAFTSGGAFSAFAIVVGDGGASWTLSKIFTGASVDLQMSGSTLQVKQTSGGTLGMTAKLLQLS